jgi:hypothetical protein
VIEAITPLRRFSPEIASRNLVVAFRNLFDPGTQIGVVGCLIDMSRRLHSPTTTVYLGAPWCRL